MPGVFRVGFEDAIGRGVIASSIHSIGPGFVERGRESHIASIPAGNGDFCHNIEL